MGKLQFILSSVLFSIISFFSFAQAPDIEWQKCLGGSNGDAGRYVQQTSDGGFVMIGNTESNDGDVTGNNGNRDIRVVKLNAVGDIEWQNCLGGSNEDDASQIEQTSDMGYILCGYTTSNDGDVTGHQGNRDFWVVKLSPAGMIQWQKTLGGTQNDTPQSVTQTNDGGYIVSGWTISADGDVSSNTFGGMGAWVVKLSAAGNVQWQNSYGGSGADQLSSVEQTSDNGYIMGGFTLSNDGDVVGYHGGGDAWILKTNSAGVIEWQSSLGGSLEDNCITVHQLAGGNYIVGGQTNSNDGNVSGNHGGIDAWVVKLNALGGIIWQKCLGGTGDERAYNVLQTSDFGYVMGGWTNSNNGDVGTSLGNSDFWIVKLSNLGTVEWNKAMGGSNIDEAYSIIQTTDNRYVLTGKTHSNDEDVSGNHGNSDAWVVKIGCFDNASVITETVCSVLTVNSIDYTSTGIYQQVLSNAAGCDSTITINLTVDPLLTFGSLSLQVNSLGQPVENMPVHLYGVQPGQYSTQELVTDPTGFVLFENLPYGNYIAMTRPNIAIPAQSSMIPTFFNGTFVWHNAEELSVGCGLLTSAEIDNITVFPPPEGPGQISGFAYGLGNNREGDPIPGIPIIIAKDTGSSSWNPPPGDGVYSLFGFQLTDETGHYSFPDLEYGHYKVDVVIPGLYTYPDPSETQLTDTISYYITIQTTEILFSDKSFYVDPEVGVFLDPDEPNCSGDLNGDGIISYGDLTAFLSEFGCLSLCTYDLNGDGAVNYADLTLLLSNYGLICP